MKTREDKIYSFFGHLVMTILTLLAIIPILLMFISSLTMQPCYRMATLFCRKSGVPTLMSGYSHPAAPW